MSKDEAGDSEKSCFVIAPIGEDDSPTRRRSDNTLKYLIRPVMQAAGYKVERADKPPTPGLITHDIITKVYDADLVVADLTDWNANVFYELAVRHASRKAWIQIIHAPERPPFDIRTVRTITFDLTDPSKIDAAKEELVEHLEHVEANPHAIETPISAALDLSEMRRSGDRVERAVADVQTTLSELAAEVRALRAEHLPTLFPTYGAPAAGFTVSGQPAGFTASPTGYALFPTEGPTERRLLDVLQRSMEQPESSAPKPRAPKRRRPSRKRPAAPEDEASSS